MTTETKPRPWTDADMAVIAETLGRPRAAVASMIGRAPDQVSYARRVYRSGHVRTREAWTPEEDRVVRDASLSSVVAAARLPGRSPRNVKDRRKTLAVRVGHKSLRDPFAVGSRPLLAKSCAECGFLLPADWFPWVPSRKVWSSQCKRCKSVEEVDRAVRRERNGPSYQDIAQAVTLKYATRQGFPYTERDSGVLADPSLTAFAKALTLERSFHAVDQAARAAGLKSHQSWGNPERDRWLIDNPNLPRVQEIKAALEAARTTETDPSPAWDWDD